MITINESSSNEVIKLLTSRGYKLTDNLVLEDSYCKTFIVGDFKKGVAFNTSNKENFILNKIFMDYHFYVFDDQGYFSSLIELSTKYTVDGMEVDKGSIFIPDLPLDLQSKVKSALSNFYTIGYKKVSSNYAQTMLRIGSDAVKSLDTVKRHLDTIERIVPKVNTLFRTIKKGRM